MPAVPCPLCGWDAQSTRELRQDTYCFSCQLCGRYVISCLTSTVLGAVDAEDGKLVPYLRAHTKQATGAGGIAELTEANWRDLARGHMNTPVTTKLRKVMEYLAEHSQYPSDAVEFSAGMLYPLFDAASEDELKFLLEHLAEKRLVATPGDGYLALSVAG